MEPEDGTRPVLRMKFFKTPMKTYDSADMAERIVLSYDFAKMLRKKGN
jgi:hypothetical protein